MPKRTPLKRGMGRTNIKVDIGQQGRCVAEYGSIWNSMRGALGMSYGLVAPNALDGVDVSDVKCLINHDFSYVIGRTQAGTLELQVDEKGLHFKCHLPNTSYARDIYENIKAGNVNQCSFFYTLPPN